MPHTGDPRLDELIELYQDVADELATELTSLSLETEDRRAIYVGIIAILADLRNETEEWLTRTAESVFNDGDAVATALLETLDLDDFGELDFQEEIDDIVQEYGDSFFDAIASVQGLALQLSHGNIPSDLIEGSSRRALVAGTLGVAALAALRSNLIDNFKKSAVSILGSDQKLYRFSLGYYATLQANQMKYDAISRAAMLRTEAAGQDLVQVSLNYSTIGDYCDEYRGKVFSISGDDPNYPSVNTLPNGGCPMHPNCHHVLLPFVGENDTGELPEEFAALAEQGIINPNEFQKVAVSLQKE